MENSINKAINFISSKDNYEDRVMQSKKDNIEIMTNDKEDAVIEELFDSLIKKNQIGLEKVMRGSNFISDSVHLLYYNCPKMNLDHGGLDYI